MAWEHEGAERMELHFANHFDSLPRIGAAVMSAAQQFFGAIGEAKELHDLRLAVQEAATNLIEHGAIVDDDFVIRFERWGDEFWVHFVCRGRPFDPTSVRPSLPDPLELAEGGYGLFLIHTLTDGVLYQTEGEWNTLSLRKRIPGLREAA